MGILLFQIPGGLADAIAGSALQLGSFLCPISLSSFSQVLIPEHTQVHILRTKLHLPVGVLGEPKLQGWCLL